MHTFFSADSLSSVTDFSLRTGALSDTFYTDSDLTIGALVEVQAHLLSLSLLRGLSCLVADPLASMSTHTKVFGRRVMLCDCDPFTKEYYALKYNVTDFTPIEVKDVSFIFVSSLSNQIFQALTFRAMAKPSPPSCPHTMALAPRKIPLRIACLCCHSPLVPL